MAKKDFYETLGVSKTASIEEIKKAYRNLAKQYHPDVETGNEEKFKEITEAYETLSDESKRRMYDQFGHSGSQASNFGGFEGFGFGSQQSPFQNVDIEEIFSNIFNQGFGSGFGTTTRKRSGPSRGRDKHIQITITFMKAVKGAKEQLNLPYADLCSKCKGTGAETSSDIRTCEVCHGRGVRIVRNGPFTMQRTCSRCKGTGKEILRKCSLCYGKGYTIKNKNIEIDIPEGVYTGDRMKIGGFGEPGINGGINGDLYISFHVRDHKYFHRDHLGNIRIDVPVTYMDIINHKQLQIPTIHGIDTITIPSHWTTVDYIRLRNKGAKVRQTTKIGDHYVRLIVSFAGAHDHKFNFHLKKEPTNQEFSKKYLNFIRKFDNKGEA